MTVLRLAHPLPARMAPKMALHELMCFPAGSAVLDPMMGSGTDARAALDQRLQASGHDLDPLPFDRYTPERARHTQRRS
jgi:hypothetical protein